MVFLGLIVFGAKSYNQLALNLMPDISYPTITVRTEYPEAAPEEVETLVSRPVEEALGTVNNLVEISSTSSAGLSDVVLEFTWDSNMDFVALDVREMLDRVFLPREAGKPMILRYNPSLDPIMRLGLYGGENLYEARAIAEDEIKPELEGLGGVASVKVKGGLEEEIIVEIDEARASGLGLSLASIGQRLAQENVNLAGGSLKEGGAEYLIRTLNEFRDLEEIGNVIVGRLGGSQLLFQGAAMPGIAMPGVAGGGGISGGGGVDIRLRDVARLRRGHKKREVITRINGRESVEIEIYKEADSNTVAVAGAVKEKLALAEPGRSAGGVRGPENTGSIESGRMGRSLLDRFPSVRVEIISDQSRFIKEAINEVKTTAALGGVLALVILFLFLRDLKSTLIIGASIPVSIIATFVPMFGLDITLNIMSLGGLALGIGMLVDNSIVVLESIFRCREEGDSVVEAAGRGIGDVAGAITASTLTTIAVFFPIVFVKGIAGQLFNDLALTVTFSLLASLLVAVYLIPMIASRRFGAEGEEGGEGKEGRSVRPGLRTTAERISSHWRAVDWWGPLRRALGMPGREEPDNPGAGGRDVSGILAKLLWPIRAAARLLWGLAAPPFFLLHFLMAALLHMVAAVLTALGLVLGMILRHALRWVGRISGVLLWLPFKAFNRFYNFSMSRYRILLHWALQHRALVLAVTVALFVHSIFIVGRLGSELIPYVHQGEFGILAEKAVGTPLEETNRAVKRIEEAAMAEPLIRTVFTEVGSEARSSEASGRRGEHTAAVTAVLGDVGRDIYVEDRVIGRLRRALADLVDVKTDFTLPSLFSFKTPVEVLIEGSDMAVLRRLGESCRSVMSGIEGIEDVKLNITDGNPEILITFDREKLSARGLDVRQIAEVVKGKVIGNVPTRFSEKERKIDIRLRADRSRLRSLDALRSITVNPGEEITVPLYAVADITVEPGPSEIRRVDQRRVAAVSANLGGLDLGSASREVLERLGSIDLPEGYRITLGGQNREMQTSFTSLQYAFLLSVFLVYVVMAAQFESLRHPFVILFSLPLGLIGVAYALALVDVPISIVVFIGVIVLAGVMVNDAIVLVDYINVLRRRGVPRAEAIEQAGAVRLRPILMTTATTILGLLPMALGLGEGAEIRTPMAITVIGGLIASTVLTLVVIPVIYSLLDRKDATEGAQEP